MAGASIQDVLNLLEKHVRDIRSQLQVSIQQLHSTQRQLEDSQKRISALECACNLSKVFPD